MGSVIAILFWIGLAAWLYARRGRIKRYWSTKSIEQRNAQHDKVRVVKVKGERHAQLEISKHLAKGYHLENQSSRKQVFSPLTGLLTSKQVHTLTFIKDD